MDKEKPTAEEELLKQIEKESLKKIKAQDEGDEIMFGLGVFGIIGWSVALPTVLGIALGVFLDKRFNHSFSWTITLLFAGIILGSFNAWKWIEEKTGGK